MKTHELDLARRINELEAANRTNRRLIIFLALDIVLIVSMGATQIPQAPQRTTSNLQGVVEAREFRVVNHKNEVKMVLATNALGLPKLQLFDRHGFRTIELGVNDADKGPYVEMNKDASRLVWVGRWGDRKCGAIETFNQDGKKVVAIGTKTSNDGGIWKRVGGEYKLSD